MLYKFVHTNGYKFVLTYDGQTGLELAPWIFAKGSFTTSISMRVVALVAKESLAKVMLLL